MQKISKLFLRAPGSFTNNAQDTKKALLTSIRLFSIQTEMQGFDFSEKINAAELKLKNP
jgi:hypothetical protein